MYLFYLNDHCYYRIVCQVESPRNLTTGLGRGSISGPIVVKVLNDYSAKSGTHYSFVVSFKNFNIKVYYIVVFVTMMSYIFPFIYSVLYVYVYVCIC